MNDLFVRAANVLDANWIGASTKPSARLYPHQWSWDSAFVAIGNAARGKPELGVREITTLFGGQWSNGLIPHMIFDQSATGYHPSAEVWGTAAIDASPDGVLTSGMMQPAVHATAVRRVGDALDDAARADFFADCLGPLAAWHEYLDRARSVDSGLIEIWHPWESGMDNSPLWDEALHRLTWPPEQDPEYQRVDTQHAPASERPTVDHYDRYMWLLNRLRDAQYQPRQPDSLPFRIGDVLSTSVAAMADLDLAFIARTLGHPDGAFLERSASRLESLISESWDETLGLFLNVDRVCGARTQVQAASGLLPLLIPNSPVDGGRLLETLRTRFMVPAPGSLPGTLIPSVSAQEPTFDADRYWRGPVWINICWLVHRSLLDRGDRELAQELRSGILSLVEHAGMYEYFNPLTGAGLGASDFSWTAALVLDLGS